MYSITKGGVATIDGKDLPPSGVGTVPLSWRDDDGKLYTTSLYECLHFPESPVNILSITQFAKQLEDPHGTEISTKMNYSDFHWDKLNFTSP